MLSRLFIAAAFFCFNNNQNKNERHGANMKRSLTTKKSMLLNRIENNYNCFQISLRGVSRTNLINMAGRIAAVNETYEMLTKDYAWDEEDEINFYLLFCDPLTIIAHAWESRRNDMTTDLEDAMFDVAYSDKILSEYPLIDGVDAKLYDNIMSFPD
jgi:hypothetical protein